MHCDDNLDYLDIVKSVGERILFFSDIVFTVYIRDNPLLLIEFIRTSITNGRFILPQAI